MTTIFFFFFSNLIWVLLGFLFSAVLHLRVTEWSMSPFSLPNIECQEEGNFLLDTQDSFDSLQWLNCALQNEQTNLTDQNVD